MPRPLEILRTVFGFESFRGAQAEIIDHVIDGGDALVLMPTGGGKSLCYQVPALCRPGLGVVISPLISLMQDQVSALRQLGVRAAALNSTLVLRRTGGIGAAVRGGEIDIVYVAPERLMTHSFLTQLERCASLFSPSTRLIALASGATISAPNTCSSPYCISVSRAYRASP